MFSDLYKTLKEFDVLDAFQTAAVKQHAISGLLFTVSKKQKGVDLDDGKFVHQQQFLILLNYGPVFRRFLI